jgi:hypothetical protein
MGIATAEPGNVEYRSINGQNSKTYVSHNANKKHASGVLTNTDLGSEKAAGNILDYYLQRTRQSIYFGITSISLAECPRTVLGEGSG